MNIFKKLFKKSKKKAPKEAPERWYNNIGEQMEDGPNFYGESADLGCTIPAEVSTTKSISQQQT